MRLAASGSAAAAWHSTSWSPCAEVSSVSVTYCWATLASSTEQRLHMHSWNSEADPWGRNASATCNIFNTEEADLREFVVSSSYESPMLAELTKSYLLHMKLKRWDFKKIAGMMSQREAVCPFGTSWVWHLHHFHPLSSLQPLKCPHYLPTSWSLFNCYYLYVHVRTHTHTGCIVAISPGLGTSWSVLWNSPVVGFYNGLHLCQGSFLNEEWELPLPEAIR